MYLLVSLTFSTSTNIKHRCTRDKEYVIIFIKIADFPLDQQGLSIVVSRRATSPKNEIIQINSSTMVCNVIRPRIL